MFGNFIAIAFSAMRSSIKLQKSLELQKFKRAKLLLKKSPEGSDFLGKPTSKLGIQLLKKFVLAKVL